MTDYLSVEEAKGLRGLRLVLTAGVPGPWGEAAKGIFHAKDVAFVPVRQEAAQANEALVEWIGHANAPVAVYENEPGRAAWTEIIWLGERLAPTPSLVPADPAERAAMFGLIHEIAGEQGLGWSRRLMMLDTALSLPLDDDHPVKQQVRTLAGRYGHTPESAAGAATRSAGILQLLSKQLADQRAAGRRFLVGEALSALDIYWATFAALLDPLPPDQCPMPEPMRMQYTVGDPVVCAALDTALLEHRNFVDREFLRLPLEFCRAQRRSRS